MLFKKIFYVLYIGIMPLQLFAAAIIDNPHEIMARLKDEIEHIQHGKITLESPFITNKKIITALGEFIKRDPKNILEIVTLPHTAKQWAITWLQNIVKSEQDTTGTLTVICNSAIHTKRMILESYADIQPKAVEFILEMTKETCDETDKEPYSPPASPQKRPRINKKDHPTTVYMGSANITENAEKNNKEIGLFITATSPDSKALVAAHVADQFASQAAAPGVIKIVHTKTPKKRDLWTSKNTDLNESIAHLIRRTKDPNNAQKSALYIASMYLTSGNIIQAIRDSSTQYDEMLIIVDGAQAMTSSGYKILQQLAKCKTATDDSINLRIYVPQESKKENITSIMHRKLIARTINGSTIAHIGTGNFTSNIQQNISSLFPQDLAKFDSVKNSIEEAASHSMPFEKFTHLIEKHGGRISRTLSASSLESRT